MKAASTLAARFVAVLGTPIETGHPGLTHLFPTPEKILSYEKASLMNWENSASSPRNPRP